MEKQERSRLGRLTGEMVVIVVSILLALAADAAWDSRGDRSRERGYLNGLASEFEAARIELHGDDANRSRRLAALDSLQANFGESELDHTAVAGWVGVAVEIVFFLPPTAVRNDLVSSGGLGLIRSDSLRLALLAFDQEVSKLRLMEERERVLIENELRPYLVSEFVLDSAAATAGATHRLLADQRFQNLIWARKRRLEVTQRYAGNVAAVIDRVERLLGVELEDRMAS